MNRKSQQGCIVINKKFLKWLPVIFKASIIIWFYYAYVFKFCLVKINCTPVMIIFLLFFNITYLMIIWSYGKVIYTKLAQIPGEFKLPEGTSVQGNDTLLKHFAKDLPLLTFAPAGKIRLCEICQIIKPDRAHHCSVCNKCVLKMDHHCPWFQNCVSFTNYKYFVLYLFYSTIILIFISATTFKYFIKFWNETLEGTDQFQIVFLFFMGSAMALCIGYNLIYHFYLIYFNRTTLEDFRPPLFVFGPYKNGFNTGAKRNVQEVFGKNPVKWFIPVWTSLGDGINYPVRLQRSDVII